jgi:hypothetical protein
MKILIIGGTVFLGHGEMYGGLKALCERAAEEAMRLRRASPSVLNS